MPAKLGREIWPLRRVLRTERREVQPGVMLLRDVLECGHDLPPAEDICGARYPERRRCWRCQRTVITS